MLDRPEDVISPRDVSPLARTFATTPEALSNDLTRRMTRVRAVFDERF
jgi:hypothetical protein